MSIFRTTYYRFPSPLAPSNILLNTPVCKSCHNFNLREFRLDGREYLPRTVPLASDSAFYRRKPN